MTPTEAQAIQDEANREGSYLMWFLSMSDADHPGKVIAWVRKADHHGGVRLPGVLIADTLNELRAMLPTGLSRWDATPMMGPGVVEAWD